MPITKSAKKSIRQNLRRKSKNAFHKKRVKDLAKKIQVLVKENKIKEALELLPQFYKILDKAAKVGIIKKNTASRRKSRISKQLKTKSGPQKSPEQP